jgi:hypothetical protein
VSEAAMAATKAPKSRKARKKTRKPEPPLIRVGEAAAMLGWTPWQTLNAARRGTVPCRRDGRAVWFSRIELERWLAGLDRATTGNGAPQPSEPQSA